MRLLGCAWSRTKSAWHYYLKTGVIKWNPFWVPQLGIRGVFHDQWAHQIPIVLQIYGNFEGFPENHNAWSFGWYYNDPCKSKGQHTHSSIGGFIRVLELEWIILKNMLPFQKPPMIWTNIRNNPPGSFHPPGSDRSVKPSVGWDLRMSERPSYLFWKLTWQRRSTVFYRRYIFKWVVLHCHVGF